MAHRFICTLTALMQAGLANDVIAFSKRDRDETSQNAMPVSDAEWAKYSAELQLPCRSTVAPASILPFLARASPAGQESSAILHVPQLLMEDHPSE